MKALSPDAASEVFFLYRGGQLHHKKMNIRNQMPLFGWQLAFHGTVIDFDALTEADSVGKGGDLNSHLGVHLAYTAETAQMYAEMAHLGRANGGAPASPDTSPLVHLVAYRHGPAYDASHEEFFCQVTSDPSERDPAHPLFEDPLTASEDGDPVGRFRAWLIEKGYKTMEREDVEGNGHHIIVLRPEDTLVLATVRGLHDIEELAALDGKLRALPDLSDATRFEQLVLRLIPSLA